jgi:hypothetical protein
MMQDYDRTQELVTAANNSSGASAKQYAKTLDSLETKLTQLENAWDEFSTSLINSDVIKGGVDLLTLFITAINKATSVFDGFLGSISKIGMVLALFNVARAAFNKFSSTILVKMNNLGTSIGSSIAEGMKSRQKEVEAAGKDLGEAAKRGASEGSGAKEGASTKNSAVENDNAKTKTPEERIKNWDKPEKKKGNWKTALTFGPFAGAA